ncbi:venom protein 164-like [Stegodyphus dumicola]|uniref:venom protein 164-like n=1 Tax=Stegodyphus dumicola TaxID=202533 RepID=UPI0015AA44BD|nr:venom protein 164-like [Stegodyphus dumicola]
MKCFVIATLLFVFLVVDAKVGKRCKGFSDCDEGECCVTPGIMSSRCKKLSDKGEKCSHEDDVIKTRGEEYIGHCPCVAGYDCEPSRIKDIPFFGTVKINERCVAKVTQQPEVTEGEELTEAPKEPEEE